MENTGSPARQVLNSYARSIVYDPTVTIISDMKRSEHVGTYPKKCPYLHFR